MSEEFLRSHLSVGSNTYGDMSSYKRLSEEELKNPQLRPDNRNIDSIDKAVYPLNNRGHNMEAIKMIPDSYERTLYPEERPVMRFENNAIGDRGSFVKKVFSPHAAFDANAPANANLDNRSEETDGGVAKQAPADVMGGSVKNAGWDPNHPRLSRDPNWYQGRGKDNAKEFFGNVLKGIEMGAELAL
tara:strand:- start:422 stop:982 length:561 start_codon:yes stop_codon:yes gene_type:complete